MNSFPSWINISISESRHHWYVRCYWQSFKIFKRALWMLMCWWQNKKNRFVDSTSRLEEHSELTQCSKFWLSLCSLKWILSRLSFVRSFTPKGSWIWTWFFQASVKIYQIKDISNSPIEYMIQSKHFENSLSFGGFLFFWRFSFFGSSIFFLF